MYEQLEIHVHRQPGPRIGAKATLPVWSVILHVHARCRSDTLARSFNVGIIWMRLDHGLIDKLTSKL